MCGGPKPSGLRMVCDDCRVGRLGSCSRRRARLRGVKVENVDHAVVYERDGGVCGICGEPVDVTDFHVDHIVPIALGGEHSYANAQVAHPACNKRKGVRLLAP
jgi:5-methylcytosine-specific restriction endonuclease McrA